MPHSALRNNPSHNHRQVKKSQLQTKHFYIQLFALVWGLQHIQSLASTIFPRGWPKGQKRIIITKQISNSNSNMQMIPDSHLFVTGLIHSIQSSTYQKGSKSHKDNTSFVFLFLQGFRVPCTWGPVQNQRALASPLFPHLPYMRASLHIGETSWISLCLKPFCSLKLNLIPKPKTKRTENWPRRQQ